MVKPYRHTTTQPIQTQLPTTTPSQPQNTLQCPANGDIITHMSNPELHVHTAENSPILAETLSESPPVSGFGGLGNGNIGSGGVDSGAVSGPSRPPAAPLDSEPLDSSGSSGASLGVLGEGIGGGVDQGDENAGFPVEADVCRELTPQDSGGRDPKTGRFLPGNNLSPRTGNPNTLRAAQIRRELFAASTPQRTRKICDAWLSQAEAGKPWAVKLWAEYTLGPPQALDLIQEVATLRAVMIRGIGGIE